MIASTIMRLIAVAGLLGLTGGCNLLLGIPDLGDPDLGDPDLGDPDLGDPANIASMKARFKATIQSQVRDPAPLDWGAQEQHIWRHYMGPRGVEFCGRPVNAPATQRTCHINYFRGAFGNIDAIEVNTPTHPQGDPSYDHCGTPPGDPQ